MSPVIEEVRLAHMESIKKYECPDCGKTIEQATNPGKLRNRGPAAYWDFHCLNKECKKVWRVPRALYQTAFGFWPE